MGSQQSCGCGGGAKLIFACSGAADVGEIADRAARKLTRDGKGRMFCTAGLGGRISGILKTTEAAEGVLAIDGCPLNCVKSSLEQAGFTDLQASATGGPGAGERQEPGDGGEHQQSGGTGGGDDLLIGGIADDYSMLSHGGSVLVLPGLSGRRPIRIPKPPHRRRAIRLPLVLRPKLLPAAPWCTPTTFIRPFVAFRAK